MAMFKTDIRLIYLKFNARGSLRPLGQFLRVQIPINPDTSNRHVAYAMAHGHTAEAGEAQGHFQFKTEPKLRIIFEFNSEVIHYLINEFYDPRPAIHLIHEPVPWDSLRVGKAAYKKYMEENLKDKIPKLKSYIIRETVSHTEATISEATFDAFSEKR